MILREGETCWRVANATRAAYLIDGAAYFSTLRQVMAAARRSIVIVGWDVDSRTVLDPAQTDGAPAQLLGFLNALLASRPELRAYVLCWDFSMIYTFEREKLPAYRFAWDGHERLRFRLDGVHPVAASHHQKIVVIDDEIAFAGGLDLTIRRWDTSAHRYRDPLRLDPGGVTYAPMHDVQMIVEGDAARALGDLVRARWLAATGESLPVPPAPPPAEPSTLATLWPGNLAPDIEAAPIGIARTQPALATAEDRSNDDIQEVLQLTLASIAAAKTWIYIESQYLTSAEVADALGKSLEAPAGPEIVIVLPREECGWLERSTMGVLRARVIRQLRALDSHDRLRIYYPVIPGLSSGCVNVHSKIMVVDDELARVGSANLSNRSMGLDTECDLAVDAGGDPRLAAGVALLRNRLLAEHLGCQPDRVAQQIEEHGSLIGAIESLSGGERTLQPIVLAPEEQPRGFDVALLDGLVCDPERPAADAFINRVVPGELRRPLGRSLLRFAIVIVAVAAVAAVWRWSPLRSYLDVHELTALSHKVRAHEAAPLIVLAGYLAGGLLLFPITLLLTATALVFPPGTSIVYSLLGTMASAAMTYGIGRALSRHPPAWMVGPRVNRVRRHLSKRGLLAMIASRLLPVGNFTLINLVAGAVPVRFKDFMAGNLLGVLPGILGLSVFADRLGSTLRNPTPLNIAVLAAVMLVIVGAIEWLRRRIARSTTNAPRSEADGQV